MSLAIAGMGWVTPLGNEVSGVWQRLINGETATVRSISSALGLDYPAIPVPADQTPVHPRLRRSSAISRFAVTAGLAAIADAKLQPGAGAASRVAMIFAVSNGGVIYTKRFYDQIVDSGAQAASPLLFPETVFNAPASHMAAILGITGATYTLVGDGAVGILALGMAQDLMENEAFDHCLVIAAEEADWLLCDAYHQWRLLRSKPPIEPFEQRPRGTILSEGAGAVLLSRNGSIRVEKIALGSNFRKRSEAGDCLGKVLGELCDDKTELIIASANGTFIDSAERAAVLKNCPKAQIYAMKRALGESLGASSLWQVICATQFLRSPFAPSELFFAKESGVVATPSKSTGQFRRAIVSVCGLSQQVAGVRLAIS